MFVNIPGFENHSVNECGVILNTKTGNVIKPYKSKQGYLYVKPCENGISKHLAIHRAVAMCFCDGYAENYGCKKSMLTKHKKHKNVVLVKCND